MRPVLTAFTNLLMLGTLVLGGTHRVHATPLVCAPRDVLVGHLRKTYGEVERINAVRDPGRSILVVTIAPDGQFTVLAVRPDRVACIILNGRNWSIVSRDHTRPLPAPTF